MASIPLFYCQINTDNAVLIGKILEKKDFIQQSLSSTFMKSNLDHNIQIDLSQSFASPSIICCCSTISTTLPQLLSFLNPDSSSSLINVILFIQSSDVIDWNPLVNLISAYNLSLNIVNNENNFGEKLYEIINNLAEQNIKKKSIPTDNKHKHSTAKTEVNQSFSFAS
jgi:hypothetical protein